MIVLKQHESTYYHGFSKKKKKIGLFSTIKSRTYTEKLRRRGLTDDGWRGREREGEAERERKRQRENVHWVKIIKIHSIYSGNYQRIKWAEMYIILVNEHI